MNSFLLKVVDAFRIFLEIKRVLTTLPERLSVLGDQFIYY